MAMSRRTQSSTQTRERTQMPPPVGGPTPEKIAARAYEIWLESGRPEGKDEENWYRAERELRRGAPPR